jgi:type II secretory pathway component PulC
MKSNHQLNGLLITSVALTLMTAAPLVTLAQTRSKTGNSTTQTNAETNVVPRSVFAIPTRAGDGRDPFFPLSRRMVVEAQTNKAGDTPKSAPVSLVLKGIAHSGKDRYALINDKTFKAGEEGEVVMNNSRVRVHCLEIMEDSVVVEVNGTRQELRMRPGT